MSDSYWRQQAAPIIARLLAEHGSSPPSVLRKALRGAYPFGEKKHHPYKVWLDEIARQTKLKPALHTRTFRAEDGTYTRDDPRQLSLF